jgi:hypothetical protein
LNALHHHLPEQHIAAILSHNKKHHCLLDQQFCMNLPAGHCGHDAHLSETIPSCFSCQFHFIKYFNLPSEAIIRLVSNFGTIPSFPAYSKVMGFIVLQTNKGPPHTV